MFPADILKQAEDFINLAKKRRILVATAESCTGGLIAACLTEIAGSSDVFERGFVTYSNSAKHQQLGVPEALIHEHGAVSEPAARAMAEGALQHSMATLAIAVTGIAGPGGGGKFKPVGLVHIAAAMRGKPTVHERHLFGDIGRTEVRLATVRAALNLMARLVDEFHPL